MGEDAEEAEWVRNSLPVLDYEDMTLMPPFRNVTVGLYNSDTFLFDFGS